MQFKINNTRFEYSENKLLINNALVECSPKLYQALVLFLNSDNQIISKELLIKELWGKLIVSDDSLFKIIQSIRNIFKNNGLKGGTLVNVYGKGYKIEPKIIISRAKHIELTNQSQKSMAYFKYIILSLVIITIISLYYVLPNNKNSLIFSPERYTSYKLRIKQDPISTLRDLNNLTNLDAQDLSKLSYLKGFANFSRGHYKEALINFKAVLKLKDDDTGIEVADTYYILALINLYSANDQKLLEYLTRAGDIYKDHNNIEGTYEIENLNIDFLMLTHKDQEAITASYTLLEKAKIENYPLGEIKAKINLYQISLNQSRFKEAKEFLQSALDTALEIGNGKYIAYCYGSMAFERMDKGDFIQAMKLANQTLKYAVVQPNTNNFQQGFSYMYNILSTLGHDQLAEIYLQKAIDVQDHFNSNGHIHIAEINLGILKIKLKKHKEAKNILNELLSYNLADSDKHAVKAWIAINSYFLEDNISAYTSAKEVHSAKNLSKKNHFIAGIALVLSSLELERNDEAQAMFSLIKKEANPDWLIAYDFYLSMANKVSKNFNQKNYEEIKILRKDFDERMDNITNQTHPDKEAINALNSYLDKILN